MGKVKYCQCDGAIAAALSSKATFEAYNPTTYIKLVVFLQADSNSLFSRMSTIPDWEYFTAPGTKLHNQAIFPLCSECTGWTRVSAIQLCACHSPALFIHGSAAFTSPSSSAGRR